MNLDSRGTYCFERESTSSIASLAWIPFSVSLGYIFALALNIPLSGHDEGAIDSM